MANLLSQFQLDLQGILNLEGLLHTYIIDKKNKVIFINDLLAEIAEEVMGIKKQDILNKSLDTLFSKHPDIAELLCEENETVMKEGIPKQFYNTWIAEGIYEIEMFTTKLPLFNKSKKVIGVLGISQYINKFSQAKAIEYGLSKRESECLFYILKGKPFKKIAQILDLSTRTVEHYLENVKNKLNCSSKTELMLKAIQNGFKEDMKQGIAQNKIIEIKEK